MDNRILIVVAVCVAVAIILAIVATRRRRSRELRQHFGPEYDRALRQQGSARRAENVLEQRAKRVETMEIRPLPETARQSYAQHWLEVQRRFVDDPGGAIAEADRLIVDVMGARGYPMADFEQRAADISVAHPIVVEHYREAQAIAFRRELGQTSTEDLRKAMVHYRSLFDDLLGPSGRREVA